MIIKIMNIKSSNKAPNDPVKKLPVVFMAAWINAVTRILPFVRLKS